MSEHPLLTKWRDERLTRERSAAQAVALHDEYERLLRWVQDYDERDEREYQTDRVPRDSNKTLYRGISRLYKTYAKAASHHLDIDEQMVYTQLKHDLDRMYSEEDMQQVVHPRHIPQWKREKRNDMRDNLFYAEWIEQLSSKEPVRSYSMYVLYVSFKAVVRLLTEHHGGWEALRSVHPAEMWLPTREEVLVFKNLEDYHEDDPEWYVTHALACVPCIWEAAQTLQLYYSALVRTEQLIVGNIEIDPTLPDDPVGESLPIQYEIPESIRIEAALQAFTAEEGSADAVATRYGIGQKRFRQIVRDRGLMPGRGGNRRG